MSQAEIHPSVDASEHTSDDFKQFKQIGGTIEDRLKNVGILSYEQLARKTPQELAEILKDMVGFTPERIDELGWIAQAKELASKANARVQEGDLSDTRNKQREESFIVRLHINAENNIRSTIVERVKDKDEPPGSWPGYDAQRLKEFIFERASLQIEENAEESADTQPVPLLESAPATQTEVKATAAMPMFNVLDKAGVIQLEPHYSGSVVSKGIIPVNVPFNIRLTLDLSQTYLPVDSSLNYIATVYAKKVGVGVRHAIGASEGTFMPADNVIIDVASQSLSSGTYKMDAVVKISPPDQAHSKGNYPMVMVEGATFHVY